MIGMLLLFAGDGEDFLPAGDQAFGLGDLLVEEASQAGEVA